MLDITAEVRRAIAESGIGEGICHLFIPHTTAGITINEGADPSVRQDILSKLDRLIPQEEGYRHAEGNAAAHIKASLVGSSATAFVHGGRISLGTWQSVFLCEFDGPRQREVWMMLSIS
jgi:secondary thiamine-phosphate synthase enzyme